MPELAQKRREHDRFGKNCSIAFKVLDSDNLAISAQTTNISGGGICLNTSDPIEVDQTLGMRIHVPGLEYPLLAIGVVKWLKAAQEGEGYEVGVSFWMIGSETELQEDPALLQVRMMLSDVDVNAMS